MWGSCADAFAVFVVISANVRTLLVCASGLDAKAELKVNNIVKINLIGTSNKAAPVIGCERLFLSDDVTNACKGGCTPATETCQTQQSGDNPSASRQVL